jgi:hypothetical protein
VHEAGAVAGEVEAVVAEPHTTRIRLVGLGYRRIVYSARHSRGVPHTSRVSVVQKQPPPHTCGRAVDDVGFQIEELLGVGHLGCG